MNPAILLIDMQTGYLQHVPWRAQLVNNHKKILRYSRKKDLPVIKIEFKGVGKGYTINDLFFEWVKIPQRSEIEKHHCNAFKETVLIDMLKIFGSDCLLAMGLFASECIYDTALGAKEHGFDIFTAYGLIADGHIDHDSRRGVQEGTEQFYYEQGCPILGNTDEAISKLEEMLK